MERRNIFDVVRENTDLDVEVERIQELFDTVYTIENSIHSWTIYEVVNTDLFDEWKCRGHCLELDDFLARAEYDALQDYASDGGEPLLLFIELIYNFWWLVDNKLKTLKDKLSTNRSFYLLQEIMDDVLAQMNYKVYKLPEEECVLVGENKPEVTSVAEIIDHSLVLPVLQYNHFALKGDIKAKKGILLALGSDLEAKRTSLGKIDKQLCSDIFYMLNNMNLRHNNVNQEDEAKYKAHVAQITEDELEFWYDELYQMILLAYLELDNEERKEKITQLKSEMGAK